jgi:biofilm PGA synthesis N-glycosyltransferase PgaC
MYVLITPAKNEEGYIERTILSVIHQTILPATWVIVDDGSSDRTPEIIRQYGRTYDFIHPLAAPGGTRPHFGSKVRAFNLGLAALDGHTYDFLGNLDADVSFAPTYYEEILSRLSARTRLGIAGGMIHELINGRYLPQNVSTNSVAGAVQMFRRECYKDIGGYIPIRSGGIDTAAEIMARAKGWEVETIPEIHVLHHRRVRTGTKSTFTMRFRQGMTNYSLGYDPLFQVASSLRQSAKRPYIIGGALILAGYVWARMHRTRQLLPRDVMHYLRSEQKARLRALISRTHGPV